MFTLPTTQTRVAIPQTLVGSGFAAHEGRRGGTESLAPLWFQCSHAGICVGVPRFDNLTFACGPHHRLLTPGGWKTRKRSDGTTEWIPPPNTDTGKPRTNGYFQPERYLTPDNTDED